MNRINKRKIGTQTTYHRTSRGKDDNADQSKINKESPYRNEHDANGVDKGADTKGPHKSSTPKNKPAKKAVAKKSIKNS